MNRDSIGHQHASSTVSWASLFSMALEKIKLPAEEWTNTLIQLYMVIATLVVTAYIIWSMGPVELSIGLIERQTGLFHDTHNLSLDAPTISPHFDQDLFFEMVNNMATTPLAVEPLSLKSISGLHTTAPFYTGFW